ncbi:hypothetical protein QBC37DRAFT_190216 [Rhypophila decipiens]|uniref:NADH:flavin oxidoreductase/NADH oxidase N-terminal domain-containing protein n=1 Tax=Rhypophila decipiens TaxID=261697 RepID=A0AAN6YGB8_9PEZI|nr:hypothetical protein QBC37DRAFT_190216 [Rhypophila decipiens]
MSSTTTKPISSSTLFTPLSFGKDLTLSSRIAMPPLTRFRANAAHIPTPKMIEYYSQRANVPGSLLITEGTFISPSAGGFPHIPGIWSDEQIAAWKPVVDAVHAKGSFIYMQLWALGRAANKSVADEEGFTIMGASPILQTRDGEDCVVPKEMSHEEISQKVQEFAAAARNAVLKAGFDGVEIHGANGYLVDQFIQDVTNTRGDEYGGSVENRGRFALEVVKAVADAVGPERVGLRLSPWTTYQGMKMDSVEKIEEQFGYVIREVQKLGTGYVHLVRAAISGNTEIPGEHHGEEETLDFAVQAWGKERPLIIAGGLTPETARQLVEEEYPGYPVVVAFGRHYVSTPDLVFRVKEGIPLNPYDRSTFYTFESEVGYLDQKFSKEFEAVYGPEGKGGLN